MRRTRLLVVDDHPLMRLGVVDIVGGHDDIEVVGETMSGQARAAIERVRPSVVIIGIHPGSGTRIDAAARLIGRDLGIVVLDETEDRDGMMRALDEGFAAYVAMSGTTDEIVAAIRHAQVCPGSFAAAGLAEAVRATNARDTLLSTRERQVLALLGDGRSGTEIAARLGVSDSSVKTYLTRIYGKLEVTNRSQALVAALGLGLLPVGGPS